MNNPTCTEVKKTALTAALLEIARAARPLYPNMVDGPPKFLRVLDDESVTLKCVGRGPLKFAANFRVAFDELTIEVLLDLPRVNLTADDVELLGRIHQFLAVAVRHNGLGISLWAG